MNGDRIAEAEKLFHVLVGGRMVDREAAQNRLCSGDSAVDRDHVRRRIMEALEGPFSATQASRDPGGQRAWARCWLLSTLGRIADDDMRAGEYVRRSVVISEEPNPWARYWALESLIVAKVPDLAELAESISSKDDEPLVVKLATAILASQGDPDAVSELVDGASDEDWATLRALRVVPIEEAVPPICEIVASPKFSDSTYDSIVALGSVLPDWSAADAAITALITCIKACRRHPWWDGMRQRALRSLAKFRSSEAVPILVDELSDSNPAIVYEAARALERTIGVGAAAARIVEAASKAGEEAVHQYANALRWMLREDVVNELESLMHSGPVDQRDTARTLLSEVGGRAAFEKLRVRTNTMKQHLETLERTEEGIRELFDSSLREARSGYRIGALMDIMVFALGVAFLVISATLVLQGKATLAALTGTGGALAVIYNLLLANPRRRVQESVEHLMSLKVVFLAFLRQLHQADKAYVCRFIDETALEPTEVKEYADIVAATMREAIMEIRRTALRLTKDQKNPAVTEVSSGSEQPNQRIQPTARK